MKSLLRLLGPLSFLTLALGSAAVAGDSIDSGKPDDPYTYTQNTSSTMAGSYYRDTCRPGDFMVGMKAEAAKDLNQIAALCQPFTGTKPSGDTYELNTEGRHAEVDGVDSAPRCDAGDVVTGIRIDNSHAGTVHRFKLRCSVPGTDETYLTAWSSTRGGQGGDVRDGNCSAHGAGAGVAGGSNSLIDRLELMCMGAQAPTLPPPSQKITSVMIESMNFPGMFWRHQNWQGLLTKLSSELDYKDATFNLSPALTRLGSTAVSFESAEYPGYYLRHKNFVVVLEKNDGSQQFALDASFKRVQLKGQTVFFESVNFPKMYIRHKDFKLLLNKNDGSQQFAGDAAFHIDPAVPPPQPLPNTDNTDNNPPPPDNKGGQASAATATTIYDQPEGNDVAYLDAGDPVTIVSCNDNNWCQISKPERGWVWGDDLNR